MGRRGGEGLAAGGTAGVGAGRGAGRALASAGPALPQVPSASGGGGTRGCELRLPAPAVASREFSVLYQTKIAF